MTRVLVADDEILVRLGLRALADWEAEGYEIAAEAASGEEAASLLESVRPDVVLTDLVMGPGDGLFLVREIRRRLPWAGIVILSCRNDFEAVREAMRLGADDYVFKLTMKAEEILQVLGRVAAKAGERRAAAGEGPGGGPSGARPAAREDAEGRAFAAWALGEDGGSDPSSGAGARASAGASAGDPAAEAARGLELARTAGLEEAWLSAYRIALFEPAPAVDAGELSPEAFYRAVRELRRTGAPDFRAFPAGRDRVLALLRGSYRGAPRELWERVDEYARRYLGRGACGGASEPAEGAPGLRRAAAQAREAAESRFYSGAGFSDFAELAPPAFPDPAASARRLEMFRAAARAGNLGELLSLAREQLTSLAPCRSRPADWVRRSVWDFLAPLRERAAAARIDVERVLLDGGLPPHRAILEAPDLPALAAGASALISALSAEISRSEASGCREEILRVKDWVRKDLAAPKGVDAAAAVAGMSPSHFAHVFTREAGESFLQFVTRARMERARELLVGSDLRIYEIARELGYENPNYFSTAFKQATGTTPQECRDAAGRPRRQDP